MLMELVMLSGYDTNVGRVSIPDRRHQSSNGLVWKPALRFLNGESNIQCDEVSSLNNRKCLYMI
jgi:hypothetical protein